MSVKVLLGKDDENEDIFWEPKKEKNPHFMAVGTSGSGKTESLKAIVHDLHTNNVPAMIIDFHQDFEDVNGNVLDFNNITINPLEYGAETPETVMYKVSHILKKIFKLGVQQEGALQDAIQRSYRQFNIDMKSTEKSDLIPTFEDVKSNLEGMAEFLKEEKRSTQIIDTLLVRLRPLFDTGFFTDKKSTIPFSDIFKETTVLRLKNMPTEEVKYAIAEFFINKLKYELYAKGKTNKIVLYCIVDEAHRLIDERSPLNDLLRESRKYGTGVILSSQRPSDFSETVLANLGGVLALQCRLEKDAIFISKQMGINFEDIKNLTEIGTGFVNFSSTEQNKKVKITPDWERSPVKKKKKKVKKVVKEEKIDPKEEQPTDDVEEDVVEEEIIEEEEEIEPIKLTKEYRHFPPLLWMFKGFKVYFSSVKLGLLFALAVGLSVGFLEPLQYATIIGFFFFLLMVIGFKYRHVRK